MFIVTLIRDIDILCSRAYSSVLILHPFSIAWIISDIYKASGIKGLYKGWRSTILRDVPFSAIYWLSFEWLKVSYANMLKNLSASASGSAVGASTSRGSESSSSGNRNLGVPLGRVVVGTSPTASSGTVTFLSGATAGVVAALITHPFDVLKTQQQLSALSSMGVGVRPTVNPLGNPVQNLSHAAYHAAMASGVASATAQTAPCGHSAASANVPGVTGSAKVNGVMGAIATELQSIPTQVVSTGVRNHNGSNSPKGLRDIFREAGVRGLYQGLTMRLATVIPSSAILVTVYETILRM
jgi:hypothetical protein